MQPGEEETLREGGGSDGGMKMCFGGGGFGGYGHRGGKTFEDVGEGAVRHATRHCRYRLDSTMNTCFKTQAYFGGAYYGSMDSCSTIETTVTQV